MIIDHKGLDTDEVIEALQETSYPNGCIAPIVMSVDTAVIDYSDDHPLNTGDRTEEFIKLFTKKKEKLIKYKCG